MVEPAIAVFARAPERGRVKTRLAAVVGEAEALTTHIELMEHSLGVCCAASTQVELWIAGDPRLSPLPLLADRFGVRVREQVGADLGARMLAALRTYLLLGRPAVIVGSDIPSMAVSDIRAAVEALESGCDVVIGPSEDGGYWLIGLARDAPQLFSNMPWGSAEVLHETRVRAAGLQLAELATLWDVDTVDDWRRWRDLRPA